MTIIKCYFSSGSQQLDKQRGEIKWTLGLPSDQIYQPNQSVRTVELSMVIIICCLVGMVSFLSMEQWSEQGGKLGSRTPISEWKCLSVLPPINKSVSTLPTHLVKERCLEPLTGPKIGKGWVRVRDASVAPSENEKELVEMLYYSSSVCTDDSFTIWQTDCKENTGFQ